MDKNHCRNSDTKRKTMKNYYTVREITKTINSHRRKNEIISSISPQLRTIQKKIEHADNANKSLATNIATKNAKFGTNSRDLRQQRTAELKKEITKYLNKMDAVLTQSNSSTGILKWNISSKELENGRKIYQLKENDSLEPVLLQQVGKAIRERNNISSFDRHSMALQMYAELKRDAPICIIKADIKHFYETINRQTLLTKIIQDNELDWTTTSIVADYINNWDKNVQGHKSSVQGLPQGVSLSTYLAEYLLADFDKTIQTRKDVYFYHRYVDDMIFIVPCHGISYQKIESRWKRNLEISLAELGLTINWDKYKFMYSASNSQGATVNYDFLGYKFKKEYDLKGKPTTEIKIGDAGVLRIKSRIRKSIQTYINKTRFARMRLTGKNAKTADRLVIKKQAKILEDRIKYLASNRKVVSGELAYPIGIFFNYQACTNVHDQLMAFDDYLRQQVSLKLDKTDPVAQRINKISFVKGFEEKNLIT